MKIAELQSEYGKAGHYINHRAGVWYITRIGKPLQILKRYSKQAAEDINANIIMLEEYVVSLKRSE